MSSTKILIADDHEAFRRSLRTLVESQSKLRICGEAADGKEAVEKARELKPDLILLDVSMPRMNGLDAARQIRQEMPKSKIVMVSQNEAEVVKSASYQAGADGFINKSSDSRRLVEQLQNLAAGVHGKRKAEIDPAVSKVDHDFLTGEGEMAARMRALDWSQTPLGPIEHWPQSLKTSISICLASRFPIVMYWGPEYVVLYNDAYSTILGKKHPWALGQPCSVCWAEIWETIGPMLDSVVSSSQATWSNDLLLLLERNGYPEECYFSFSFSPIRVESGSVGGVFTAVIETTEHVIGERRLRTLRDLAAAAVDGKTEPDVLTLSAKTLSENLQSIPFSIFCKITGDQKVHVLDTAGIESAHPFCALLCEPGSVLSKTLREAAKSRTASEVKHLRSLGPLPTGSWKIPPKSLLVLPVGEVGEDRASVLWIAAVNPHKKITDNYQTFFQLAAHQIATSLANARSYEEERRRANALAELDRAKTAFFSNVSHEFRTPLTLMLGPLEDALSSTGGVSQEQREKLEVAHRNSLRLLKLVNTLLDFSRIEAGRIEACYEPTDLSMLTSELASFFHSAAERAGLRLLVNCSPLPEPVYVDREMWEKVVFNLLSNAFKFTFEGELEVSLLAANGAVELSVRDTGTGIAESEIPQLFERFYRVKGARGRSYEGSGIGLALVQELVKLHGGSVRVQSQLGRGSTFTVTVPFGKEHLPSDRIGAPRKLASTGVEGGAYVQELLHWLPGESQVSDELPIPLRSSSAQMPQEHVASGKRSTILLVDDNADMREYVCGLLSDKYEVITAEDGEIALQKARKSPPDLILSDVMMPRLDGFGLLKAIRGDGALNSIPVVLLSARAGEESRVEGLDAGADDYLVKPFSARELLARVGSSLAMAKLRREASDLEKKLRTEAESERGRLRELFKQAPAVIAFLNGPEHRFTFVNRDYVRLTGRQRDEDFVGKTVREVFPEVEGQGIFELLDGVYQTGVPYSATARRVVLNRGPQGQSEDVYFDFVYQPMRDAVGQVEGILIHAVDVTEQVLAHQELEKRERQFRETIDALPAAIYTTDAEGRLTHYNQAAVRFSGHTPQLGTDQWCVSWKLYYPDGTPMPHDQCPMAIALKEGRIIEGAEAIAERPDGTRRWFTPFPTPLRDKTGKIIGGINMLVDITDRKEAAKTTNLLAAIVDSSDDAIVSKNLDGFITSWNKGAERIFGYTAEEAVGQHITLIVPTELHSEEAEILSKLRRGERIDHFQTIRRRRDGALLNISLTISPLRDASGRVVGASKVARDITAQKRAEEALRHSEERFRRLSETLDAEVQARTLELQQLNADVLRQSEQLRELSWRLLRIQDDERRRIARELHDSAGQTLTVLGMNIAQVAQKVQSAAPSLSGSMQAAEDLIQQLHQEIRTMSYLLHPPLLDETGLAAALSWYVEGLRSRSRLELTLSISEDLARLPSDMELVIFRVVQECLTNIHRHSGSKSAAITITRLADAITVEVRDRGRGMSAKKLAEIQSRGSGVGIRGMRERVRQLHGEMTIESDGSGTRVFASIPIPAERVAKQELSSASLPAAV